MIFIGKTALIVFAHQERTSFNYAMLEAAQAALQKKGWTVLVSDLYEMKFNPVLSRDDITGEPKEPSKFKYGVETLIAWQEGRLAKDIEKEHKKLEEADLVIFQFPMYWLGMPAIMKGWVERVLSMGFAYSMQSFYSEGPFKNKKAVLSFTTGGPKSMTTPKGMKGDMNVLLWPIQSGILNFCGYQIMEPQISYGINYSIAHSPAEKRSLILEAWQARLDNIWEEKPICFAPNENFELSFAGGFVLKKDVIEKNTNNKYGLTVGQHEGKAFPPDNQVKAGSTRL
ncbi:NAD(P)H quinone dehydrogenase 1 [Pristimantis euphronides]